MTVSAIRGLLYAAWFPASAALSNEGITKESVTPLDRLAYMSSRAMGALEFRPHAASKTRLLLPSSDVLFMVVVMVMAVFEFIR